MFPVDSFFAPSAARRCPSRCLAEGAVVLGVPFRHTTLVPPGAARIFDKFGIFTPGNEMSFRGTTIFRWGTISR